MAHPRPKDFCRVRHQRGEAVIAFPLSLTQLTSLLAVSLLQGGKLEKCLNAAPLLRTSVAQVRSFVIVAFITRPIANDNYIVQHCSRDCCCEFRANRVSQQSGFERELFSAEAIFNSASPLTYRAKAASILNFRQALM